MGAVKADLTPKQLRMLELLGHYDGEGTMEVRLQWGECDFGDGEAAEAKAWRVNGLAVAGLVRSLVRKGYATNGDGYGITDAGREALARHGVVLKRNRRGE